ncbi:hypothetical protein ACHAW6_010184 [Cyclotella cf. meneghiniana]
MQMSSSPASSSPRFGYWVAFFIFSTITLGATIEAQAHTDRLSPGAQTNQMYAVACSSCLFILSTCVVILHTRPLISSVILGTKIEGIIIFILVSLWSALVAIVSDTRHGLATDFSGSISNGNLYYFSWAGLVTGVALMTSFVRTIYGIDVLGELKNRALRLQSWVWLAMFGLIQMGSSARLFDNHCGTSSGGLGEAEKGTVTFCRRCQLGVALGFITTITAMIVVVLKIGITSSNKLSSLFTAEMVMSGMMIGSEAVGVAFLTGQGGPGAPLNNLYYSTWGTLVVSLVLVASCVEDYSSAKGEIIRSRLGEEAEGLELR